MEQECTYLT